MVHVLRHSQDGQASNPEPPRYAGEDRRFSERRLFRGAEVYLFVDDRQHHRLHIKDLSFSGMSGLTDVPLQPGDLVTVQLEEMLLPSAEVRWTRNALVGLVFLNPLPVTRFKRLCERQKAGARWSPAMRASGSSGGGWRL